MARKGAGGGGEEGRRAEEGRRIEGRRRGGAEGHGERVKEPCRGGRSICRRASHHVHMNTMHICALRMQEGEDAEVAMGLEGLVMEAPWSGA